jgi:DNA (cytosine-5)-methyltransferase 1
VKIGSLFSGAAGLDVAVESVFGGKIAWFAENDLAASRVLAKHFPGIPNHGDVTKIDWSRVEPVDILCGGFPCTDVSAAGFKRGLGVGTRSGLWANFAIAIDKLSPTFVIIENVRGLLSTKAARTESDSEVESQEADMGASLRAAGAVFGDLADLGYDARWCLIRASDVGAPHKRERIVIIAYA